MGIDNMFISFLISYIAGSLPSMKDEFFKKSKRSMKELVDITNYYQATGDDSPTFFCRFYSMEQVYFLIREAKNQDHFVKLLNGGFVTTGTENFWNEYLNTIKFIN